MSSLRRFKYVLIGSQGAGKTSLLYKWIYDSFQDPYMVFFVVACALNCVNFDALCLNLGHYRHRLSVACAEDREGHRAHTGNCAPILTFPWCINLTLLNFEFWSCGTQPGRSASTPSCRHTCGERWECLLCTTSPTPMRWRRRKCVSLFSRFFKIAALNTDSMCQGTRWSDYTGPNRLSLCVQTRSIWRTRGSSIQQKGESLQRA